VEQRRFLRATDNHRRIGRFRVAEPFDLRAAELARRRGLGAGAAAPHRLDVERHRVLARTNPDMARLLRHRAPILLGRCVPGLATARLWLYLYRRNARARSAKG